MPKKYKNITIFTLNVEETLPNALRTQALTALTGNFGLVGWLSMLGRLGLIWFGSFGFAGLVW